VQERFVKKHVYTVGHSTHPFERFAHLLETHSITAIADVRSSPYSRVNPQFNRESLAEKLRERGIGYVFLGKELGARSNDPACYRDGKAQYELIAKTALFEQGITRVLSGADKHKVALMCAEKDPIECHRAILVGRTLNEKGMEVSHILADGKIETQEELVQRLLVKLEIHTKDMFSPREALAQEAYRIQGEAIAYQENVAQEKGDGKAEPEGKKVVAN